MGLDYASIMGAAQNLVPNMREQMLQDRELDQRDSQLAVQRQLNAAKVAEAQTAQKRQEDFAAAMEYALSTGNPRDMQRVRMLYPEFTKDLKDGFEALDTDQKRTTLTQLGSVRARLAAGDVEGATAIVSRRLEADKAAGVADEDTQELYDLLASGDPEKIKLAQGTLTYMISSVDPEKFDAVYGKLEPSDAKTGVQKEYEWRVQQFGQQDADRWLATQDESLVTVEPGGSVFRKSDFVQPRGGGPASSGGGGIVATPEQEAQSRAFEQAFGMEGVTVDDRTGVVYNPDGSVRSSLGGGVVMPVEGGSFGQDAQQYGAPRDGGSRSHNGLDISGVLGAPVKALRPGKVVAVGNDSRSGNFVRVKHPDGSISSYAHLGSQAVSVGQDVPAGFSLGTLGRSGNARAAEGRGVLHLVVRDAKGRTVDPRPMLGVPVRVRTKQEYERLASGAEYVAPDGSHRVKP